MRISDWSSDVALPIFRLIGPERVDRADMVWLVILEQYRRALPFVIAEIGAVLRITGERGDSRRKSPGILGRTGHPHIQIWLPPSPSVAYEPAAPALLSKVRDRPVRVRTPTADRSPRLHLRKTGGHNT